MKIPAITDNDTEMQELNSENSLTTYGLSSFMSCRDGAAWLANSPSAMPTVLFRIISLREASIFQTRTQFLIHTIRRAKY